MCGKKLGFTDYELSTTKRRTNREKLLAQMEEVVPWQELIALFEPHYLIQQEGTAFYQSKGHCAACSLVHQWSSCFWKVGLRSPLGLSLVRLPLLLPGPAVAWPFRCFRLPQMPIPLGSRACDVIVQAYLAGDRDGQ